MNLYIYRILLNIVFYDPAVLKSNIMHGQSFVIPILKVFECASTSHLTMRFSCDTFVMFKLLHYCVEILHIDALYT